MTIDFFVTNFSERTNQSFERAGSESVPTTCSTLDWGVEVSGLDAVTLVRYPSVGPRDIIELDIIEVTGTGEVSRLFVVARLSGIFPVAWSNRMDLDGGDLGEAGEPVRRSTTRCPPTWLRSSTRSPATPSTGSSWWSAHD